VESPEIAAARCSLTHDLAVPGTPRRRRARSEARVAMAISIKRFEPTYFAVISVPSAAVPPNRYVATDAGDNFQFGGFGRSSPAINEASSCAY
jgi:hypothetical protein